MRGSAVSRTPCRSAISRQGFTLLELVVVVLLVGVVSTVALPQLTASLNHYRAEATARRIAADINFVRADAVTRGKNRTIMFDLSSNSYSVTGVADPDEPNSSSYTVALEDTGYTAALISASFNAGTALTFNIYGQPLADGTLLISDSSVSISSGGESRVVLIDQVTGKARVQ